MKYWSLRQLKKRFKYIANRPKMHLYDTVHKLQAEKPIFISFKPTQTVVFIRILVIYFWHLQHDSFFPNFVFCPLNTSMFSYIVTDTIPELVIKDVDGKVLINCYGTVKYKSKWSKIDIQFLIKWRQSLGIRIHYKMSNHSLKRYTSTTENEDFHSNKISG
jgi:benzoyl-CoA reductase/2-hydroxyglutaryl-CoA dehydratase subunit BcrC/BadD/HgdB